MLLRQETQLAVPTREQGSINTSYLRQCHTRQYIRINQKAMASTFETTTREPGVMMRSRINQSDHIRPQSVTALSVYQNCCSIQMEPPLIRLSDLHEMRQVRASRQSQGR